MSDSHNLQVHIDVSPELLMMSLPVVNRLACVTKITNCSDHSPYLRLWLAPRVDLPWPENTIDGMAQIMVEDKIDPETLSYTRVAELILPTGKQP